eukprot:TRINITY_DN5093_c0_g1_i3.p3 TRINITY_DN5093_c0_g1~~TRINITY_DN5093_c0_g1_i3.p3  ORF type:complete len:119 (+),score=7.65 TRINITY_DN5093_c0_g1_i3:475-831(+)
MASLFQCAVEFIRWRRIEKNSLFFIIDRKKGRQKELVAIIDMRRQQALALDQKAEVERNLARGAQEKLGIFFRTVDFEIRLGLIFLDGGHTALSMGEFRHGNPLAGGCCRKKLSGAAR